VNYFVQPWRSHSRGQVFSTNLPFPLSRPLTQGNSSYLDYTTIREYTSIEIYWVTSLKNHYKGKRASPKNYVQCYRSTEIKLEVGRIPCTRNRASLQRLKPVRPISKGLCHSERTMMSWRSYWICSYIPST